MKLNDKDYLKFWRCRTCGGKIVGSSINCGGHQQTRVSYVTPFEWLKIKLRVTR